MINKEISVQLLKIAASDDFASVSTELTEAWSEAAVGVESIDAILVFMEEHPDLDYGMPGALVHFVEEYYQKGYEEKLLQSITRRPTMMTAWMLNRVINGTHDSLEKERLISAMRQATTNPRSDKRAVDRINAFLQHLNL